MTTPPQHDWDDSRLNEAFAARARRAPATPSDVADDVVSRVGPIDRGLQRRPWFVVATAAAALVVVLVGSSLLEQVRNGLSGPNASGSAEPSSATGPTNALLEALGDPISVAEAIALRDSEIGEREILVGGFLSPQLAIRCPFEPAAQNPTRLVCPETFQWFMERPEELATEGPTGVELAQPLGPATQLSFALVVPPTLRSGGDTASSAVSVVLAGHFHDRRARLCINRPPCEATFMVDRVMAVGGVNIPTTTRLRTDAAAHDSQADVDALVAVAAPNSVVLSRQLMTAEDALGIEPVLADDQLIPHIDPSKLAWIVTTVDLGDGVPIARTFMLLDGSNWFAEIVALGARTLERVGPKPSAGAVPIGPTAEPNGFAAAPSSVLGIPVHSVSEVIRQRQNDGSVDRREYAIRGWYIGPRPGVTCDRPVPAIHPPEPPCDDARHWLMNDPQVYGTDWGQLRLDPDPSPSVLNPLLPVDVPFDVAETWRGDQPVPQPVILLGHFNDTRVLTYHGDAYFVIDALAWNRTDHPIDSVTRTTDAATEDLAKVTQRIDGVSREPGLASWITVMDPGDFAIVEANGAAQDAAEFTSGAPVWIVRRLVLREDELAPGFGVLSGYTADNGTRVWWTQTPDSPADLATTIDLENLDGRTKRVRLYDYGQTVLSIRDAHGAGPFDWQRAGPDASVQLDVSQGRTLREVAIRWNSRGCGASWRLLVHDSGEFGIRIEMYPSGASCDDDRTIGPILLEFDHPVDIDRVFTGEPCCG